MATWIAHLRVADQLAKRWPIRDEIAFYVGNLGPDCGAMTADMQRFEPPSEISHWQTGPYKDSIDPERFYQAYLTETWDDFYLGYYVHLWCDLIWDREIGDPMRARFREELADRDFIWTIKRDWYAHDNHYLREQPQWDVLWRLCALEDFPNQYLDYYPADAFMKQIAYICHYYSNYQFHDRAFDYLSRADYEAYITTAVTEIDEILRLKQT